MSTNRESLLPPTSAQGSAILRSSSPTPSLREPLSTHPLLSPSPSSTNFSLETPSGNPYPTTTRYVPYTPKHRITSSATIGSTTHFPLSASSQLPHHGDATSKLQIMGLKADAQRLGLEHGSLGWAILEKLASESDQESEWNEIWAVLATGRATLLLPLEQTSETPNSELIKSHIVLCDDPLTPLPANSFLPAITLSGLRGIFSPGVLTIRSSLHPSSRTFQGVLSPVSRSSTLASLPPLVYTKYQYPSFTIGTVSSSLSRITLPPRPSPQTKPPLPPRPSMGGTGRQTATSAQSSTSTSRISNPFASLFGSKHSAPSNPSTTLSIPTPATTSQSEIPDPVEHSVDVYACTIDKALRIQDLAKSICKTLRDEVKTFLLLSKDIEISGWGADEVADLVEEYLFPFTKPSRSAEGTYAVNEFMSDADEISRVVQELYSRVADAIIDHREADMKKQRSKNIAVNEKQTISTDSTDTIRGGNYDDSKIITVVECVEGTICDLFYDRLFMPSNSDDILHDEALSSRIAALNMLDLSLDHLGVEVKGDAQKDVHEVITACGEILSMLGSPSCRRPAEKSAILVKAHKVLVDKLSKLPPVRLRPDNEHSLGANVADSEKEMKPMSSDKRMAVDDHEDSVNSALTPELTESPTVHVVASVAHPSEPTPVSGDVILPLMIFSVVKSNPTNLLSHLLYIQRFRNQAVGGEESYCLINLMAVAEFLENVDLARLGLGGESERVINTAQLSPISVVRSRSSGSASPTSIISMADVRVGGLRGRVEQQVDAIAGSANRVLSGVVDSSFGVLRALLPGNSEPGPTVPPDANLIVQESRPNAFGILRRESGFSIASLTASLPSVRHKTSTGQLAAAPHGESGQQMTEVSARSTGTGEEDEEYSSEDSARSDEYTTYEETEESQDARSIKSFESMMSQTKKRRRKHKPDRRKSITDRLANATGLGRLTSSHESKGSPPSRRSSLRNPTNTNTAARISPPNQRFLECHEDDLKISDVRELLREYRRVVACVQAMGGFQEP